jgi:hypothetical protein
MSEEIDATTGNGRLYIRSIDTSNPMGALVQEYADKSYKVGFLHGTYFGLCIGVAAGVAIVAIRLRLTL